MLNNLKYSLKFIVEGINYPFLKRSSYLYSHHLKLHYVFFSGVESYSVRPLFFRHCTDHLIFEISYEERETIIFNSGSQGGCRGERAVSSAELGVGGTREGDPPLPHPCQRGPGVGTGQSGPSGPGHGGMLAWRGMGRWNGGTELSRGVVKQCGTGRPRGCRCTLLRERRRQRAIFWSACTCESLFPCFRKARLVWPRPAHVPHEQRGAERKGTCARQTDHLQTLE